MLAKGYGCDGNGSRIRDQRLHSSARPLDARRLVEPRRMAQRAAPPSAYPAGEVTMHRKTSAILLVTLGIATAGATGAHADTGASPGSNGELDPLLLGQRQVSAITGAAMVEAKLQTDLGRDSSFTDAARCASAWAPSQESAYAGAPFSTFSGATLADVKSPKPFHHNVVEAVFEFTSTSAAVDYVNKALSDWRRCSNQTVSYQPPGVPAARWQFGTATVSQGGTMLSLAQQPAAAPGFSCERALTHRANIVIDTMACGADSSGQAVSVAAMIGERIARSV
jgi:serine/threonine-protein kinase